MTKRLLSLLLLAFSLLHLLAVGIFLVRFHTIKLQSLFLGTVFLVVGIWLYRASKKKENPSHAKKIS